MHVEGIVPGGGSGGGFGMLDVQAPQLGEDAQHGELVRDEDFVTVAVEKPPCQVEDGGVERGTMEKCQESWDRAVLIRRERPRREPVGSTEVVEALAEEELVEGAGIPGRKGEREDENDEFVWELVEGGRDCAGTMSVRILTRLRGSIRTGDLVLSLLLLSSVLSRRKRRI